MAGDDDSDIDGTNIWVYTGIYIAYFCGIILLSVIVDRCGFADKTMTKLGQGAHSSFMKYEYPKLNKNYDEPEKEPGCCSNKKKIAPAPTGSEDEFVDHSCRAYCMSWFFGKKIAEVEYNPLFVKKLLTDSAYWGIEEGMVGFWKYQQAILADYVFLVYNTHALISLFCASKRSRLGRKERRHAFIVQHCLAFFLTAALQSSFDDAVSRTLVNVFVVIPVCLLVNSLYLFLLTCPCLIREYEWCCCQIIADFMMKLGRIVAFPFVLVAICLLLAAAVFTTGDNFGSVIRYAYEVHCLSIVQELVMISFKFRYDKYIQYKFFGITVFELGTWFKEQCEIFELSEENGDYNVVVTNWLCRIRITQWTRKPGLVRPLPLDGDVEMGEMTSKPNITTSAAISEPGAGAGEGLGSNDSGEENTGAAKVFSYVPVSTEEPVGAAVPKVNEVQPASPAASESAGPGIVDNLMGANKVGIEPTTE